MSAASDSIIVRYDCVDVTLMAMATLWSVCVLRLLCQFKWVCMYRSRAKCKQQLQHEMIQCERVRCNVNVLVLECVDYNFQYYKALLG